jgi:predicted phosphodiesterase
MSSAKATVVIVLVGLIGLAAVASPFAHGPYSGAPSADSVTISWEAETPGAGRIEYGLRPAYEASGTLPEVVVVPVPEEDADDTCHVTLVDLEPGTDYVYRVVLEDGEEETSSDVGFFCTAPEPGEPVSFAVLADTQWQSEGTNRLELVGDAIASDPTPFDFVLHAGDVVESPASNYWDHWFDSFDDMLLRAPFIPVLGNHEKNHRSYYETFSLPPGEGKNDEQWWALHWGDVVIVGLDTNVKRADQYLAQQEWARTHLSGPEPHKFVIFHHPVFSSDAYHGDGYGYDVIYHPIFVEAEVDVVFNGHAHNYERIERDGVTYLVVGGGGAIPRPLAERRTEGSVVAVEGHHFYARVRTAGERITIDVVSVAVDANGSVTPTPDRILDSFALPAEPRDRILSLWVIVGGAIAGAALLWFIVRMLAD